MFLCALGLFLLVLFPRSNFGASRHRSIRWRVQSLRHARQEAFRSLGAYGKFPVAFFTIDCPGQSRTQNQQALRSATSSGPTRVWGSKSLSASRLERLLLYHCSAIPGKKGKSHVPASSPSFRVTNRPRTVQLFTMND